jgi:hypothetical protein
MTIDRDGRKSDMPDDRVVLDGDEGDRQSINLAQRVNNRGFGLAAMRCISERGSREGTDRLRVVRALATNHHAVLP